MPCDLKAKTPQTETKAEYISDNVGLSTWGILKNTGYEILHILQKDCASIFKYVGKRQV